MLHDIFEGFPIVVQFDLFIVRNEDKDGRDKGQKVVTGKKAIMDTTARRAVATNDETKKRAASVPKKWNGDWPILAAIDAKRELAVIRAKLAYVPKILDAFEWSVVDGLTLEEIGKRLGAGSKGAKGEARARVFDGFGIVDRYWECGRMAPLAHSHANDNHGTYESNWWSPGMSVPRGFYRSPLYPDMIFPKYRSAA